MVEPSEEAALRRGKLSAQSRTIRRYRNRNQIALVVALRQVVNGVASGK
jgi:hypothetical protein